MIKLVFISLLVIPSILIGQETNEIKDKTTRETYFVLQSDKTVRHGVYTKSALNEKTTIKGNYKNGVRVGIWEFYNYRGDLIQKYNFDNFELVYYKPDEDKNKKFKVLQCAKPGEILLDRPPVYLGGETAIQEIFFRNLKYPDLARRAGIAGTVYVSFIINKDGQTSYFRVPNSIGYGCDEEALRLVEQIPNNWIPGVLNGQTVAVEYEIPVVFKLK